MRDLIAPEGVAAQQWQIGTSAPTNIQGRSRYPVKGGPELDRIVALPSRPAVSMDSVRAEALVELMTRRLRRPRAPGTCKCESMGRRCILKLKPAQAWALYEAPLVGGLLGPIGVGHGKTMLDILMPIVFPGIKLAVLLIPPGLKDQLIREYHLVAEHFNVPSLVIAEKGYIVPGRPVLHVVPFSKFSRAGSTDLLEQLSPQLVIIDEAHKVRHRDTATTGRVLRYFANHSDTKLCAWSGTLTAKSIRDYAHLSAFALRFGSPLPIDPPVLEEWALAIDPSDWPAPIGELKKLCKPGEHIHSAFQRRLTTTAGVVATTGGAIDASINLIERRPPPIPPEILEMLKKLRDPDSGWVRPDGEELVDALQVAACARQLACGFYYRWVFPHGEPDALIEAWFEKRKAWHKELREALKHRRREHFDSPLLCAKAAIRAYQTPAYEGELPVWRADHWEEWRDARDTVYHETEAVWIDTYLAVDAAAWAKKHRGVVWYEHEAFGRKVAEVSGLPMHSGGPDAEKNILAERGDRSIVASIKSHGTGRDGLQRLFHEQLVANPPSSGASWEQCLDSETEILTSDGWKGIDDEWCPQVAAYDLKNSLIKWETGTRVERTLDSEIMFGISNPHLDLRVTAGHRMLSGALHHVTRKEHTYRPYEFVRADKMPRIGRIPVAGHQFAEGLPLTDDQLVFIGLFMTDGNLSPGNDAISLFQSDRYPGIVKLCDDTMRACGFRFNRNVMSPVGAMTNFGPRVHALHRWIVSPWKSGKRTGWWPLREFLKKEWSSAFEQVTRPQLEKLLFGMWAGDGSKTVGKYDYDTYESKTVTICSARKSVADGLQSLCVRRGYRCNVSKCKNMFSIKISEDRDSWNVVTKSSDARPVWGPVPSSPDERVWCASVPSGAIVVRRNGKVAVVGNCLGRLHRVGQDADEVDTHVYRHTIEMADAIDRAVQLAKYIQGTGFGDQKLLSASIGWAK